ncbi:MAG: hypothetical protein J6R66_02710 [Clostridia bacterium]|nr:hypothetical protein [Clostridia bacterium]
MTENTLLYTYITKVCEHYDLTYAQMNACVEKEILTARAQNKNIIFTIKGFKRNHFFDAFTAEVLTKDFVWIHACPQELLNFDEDEICQDKYYVLTFTACAKDGLYI